MAVINSKILVAEAIRAVKQSPKVATNMIEVIATEEQRKDTKKIDVAPPCPAFKLLRKGPAKFINWQIHECKYCWTGDIARAIQKPIENVYAPIALTLELSAQKAGQEAGLLEEKEKEEPRRINGKIARPKIVDPVTGQRIRNKKYGEFSRI